MFFSFISTNIVFKNVFSLQSDFNFTQLSSISYADDWNGFMYDSYIYIIYLDYHWIIGTYYNFSTYTFYTIEAECSIYTSPFNPLDCNNSWITNDTDVQLDVNMDCLQISSDIPTLNPTIRPSVYPTPIPMKFMEAMDGMFSLIHNVIHLFL